jgi:membrane associated rhomboid family serine protease
MEVALSSLSSFTRAVAGSPGSVVLAAALVLLNLPLLGGRVNTSLIFLPEAVRMGEWWRVLSHPFVHLTVNLHTISEIFAHNIRKLEG